MLFQNFDYGPYQMASYLPRIRDYVQRGGSFAMIGGDLSFASGGYAETPLAEILPVRMPPSSTPETEAIVTERFRPRIGTDAPRHPVIDARCPSRVANATSWSRLAPLEGANVLRALRASGRALLVHPTHRDADGQPMPVLARRQTRAAGARSRWRATRRTAGASRAPA